MNLRIFGWAELNISLWALLSDSQASQIKYYMVPGKTNVMVIHQVVMIGEWSLSVLFFCRFTPNNIKTSPMLIQKLASQSVNQVGAEPG